MIRRRTLEQLTDLWAENEGIVGAILFSMLFSCNCSGLLWQRVLLCGWSLFCACAVTNGMNGRCAYNVETVDLVCC